MKSFQNWQIGSSKMFPNDISRKCRRARVMMTYEAPPSKSGV